MTYKTKNWKRKNNKDKKDTLYKTTCCKLQTCSLAKSPPIHSQHKTWYGNQTPPRGPTPYPFIYHFSRKSSPFRAEAPRSCPRIRPLQGVPPGSFRRPVSRTYRLTQAVHCSSLSLLEKRSAFCKKKKITTAIIYSKY